MQEQTTFKKKTSYSVHIVGQNDIFEDTRKIYNDALSLVINVVDLEWNSVSVVEGKKRNSVVEKLVHQTKKNISKYKEFDEQFHKFPSYLRRAVIAKAIGIVSSYRSNLANWEEHKLGNPPKLQLKHYEYPAMYNLEQYKKTGEYTAQLKVFHQNTWKWIDVKLRKSDIDYINRHKPDAKMLAPILQKSGKRWSLRFGFKTDVKLTNRNDVIIAVDLGINNAATCSAMCSDGTIMGRKIISFPAEQDSLNTKLNKIKKAQQNGARSTPRLWAHANNMNRAISEKTAKAVMEFAALHRADVIVFEYLDMKGKVYGSKKQRLHLWRKREVQEMLMSKAHHAGMRYSRVCAWNTSRLAFDGSGRVKRDDNNYSICTFKTGKIYHCDLNASYNIGARYFIRDTLKSLQATIELGSLYPDAIEAMKTKVSSVPSGTTRTLSDLLNLNAALSA